MHTEWLIYVQKNTLFFWYDLAKMLCKCLYSSDISKFTSMKCFSCLLDLERFLWWSFGGLHKKHLAAQHDLPILPSSAQPPNVAYHSPLFNCVVPMMNLRLFPDELMIVREFYHEFMYDKELHILFWL